MLKSSDYPALEALAAIHDAGSFDLAAARLGLTPSAVSQRISGLEDRLGTSLVRRDGGTRLTKAGGRLVRHANEVRSLETGLTDLFDTGQPLPRLRIAANADSLAAWALPAFAQAGDLLFDVEIDDQDHSDQWLRDGAVGAAITSRKTPVRGCDVLPLGQLAYSVVASPAFKEKHFAKGVTAETVQTAPALVFNRKDRLQHNWATRLCGPSPQLQAHYLPSTADISSAIRLGLGWGLNPSTLFQNDLKQGTLVLLDDQPLYVPLYLQVARLSKPALAPFIAALVTQARTALDPLPQT